MGGQVDRSLKFGWVQPMQTVLHVFHIAAEVVLNVQGEQKCGGLYTNIHVLLVSCEL